MTAPGWYNAEGDPSGTHRYWDGTHWIGEPVYEPQGPTGAAGGLGRIGVPASKIASGGTRIGGWLLDLLITLVIGVTLFVFGVLGDSDDVVFETNDGGFNFSIDQAYDTPRSALIGGLLGWAWAFLWTHLKGGTPGKLIVGIRVVDAPTGVGPPVALQALVRTAMAGLPLLGLAGSTLLDVGNLVAILIGIVSLVFLFTDSNHQTVMDRVAKTVVVKQ